jgi:hypothetical protein
MRRFDLVLALAVATTMLVFDAAWPTPATARWWDAPRSGYCPIGTCNKIGGWRALNVRNCSTANCARH